MLFIFRLYILSDVLSLKLIFSAFFIYSISFTEAFTEISVISFEIKDTTGPPSGTTVPTSTTFLSIYPS